MDRPVFGPHPHAGFSVMTYLFPDSKQGFINRDSRGDFSLIEPGGVHITQAGKGIFHDEFPQKEGISTHGLQIWINHKAADRLLEPRVMHAKADQIPEIITPQYRVRVIHGSFQGRSAPYQMATPVRLLDITLQGQQSLLMDGEAMSFIYGISGMATVDEQEIGPQTLAILSGQGSKVAIRALEQPFHFIFASGTPHQEPIVYGGPFVMSTGEQMQDAKSRMAKGEMGKLLPYQRF